MWKTNISLQHLKLILGTKLFFRQKRFLKIMFSYIFSFILEFRNLKFPELESWELFPELGNFGTFHSCTVTQASLLWEWTELRNLFKGIPMSMHTDRFRQIVWVSRKPPRPPRPTTLDPQPLTLILKTVFICLYNYNFCKIITFEKL